ncbi:hypothetical protein ACFQZ4_17635 [Catellatospora coxensis]
MKGKHALTVLVILAVVFGVGGYLARQQIDGKLEIPIPGSARPSAWPAPTARCAWTRSRWPTPRPSPPWASAATCPTAR